MGDFAIGVIGDFAAGAPTSANLGNEFADTEADMGKRGRKRRSTRRRGRRSRR